MMTAKGQCSGCSFTGPPSRVEAHQRHCEGFAELYRRDPALALLNPVDVYAAAHLPALVAEADPLVEAGAEIVRRARRAKVAKPEVKPSVRVAGPVFVEYWDWQLTMLEELQGSTT